MENMMVFILSFATGFLTTIFLMSISVDAYTKWWWFAMVSLGTLLIIVNTRGELW